MDASSSSITPSNGSSVALRTVSFGFRDPQFRLIGVPMGICRRHEHYIGKGRMHVIVDPPRR